MYDVVILGGGPAGYRAAERTAEAGLQTVLIEERQLGGTCLNVGCIPTKTLLNSAKTYAHIGDSARIGVTAQATFDLSAAMKWKTQVVGGLRKGIAATLKKRGVQIVDGRGMMVDRNAVQVGDTRYEGRYLVLASGSSPAWPPIPGIDSPGVVNSSQLLEISDMPKAVTVVGGGYIGMEFASFFALLGVPVTVVEMMDEIIPFMEPDLAALLRKSVSGVSYELGARVSQINEGSLTFERDGREQNVDSDLILISTGRQPNVDNLGYQANGLDVDRSGIRVNDFLETNLPNVFAVGDVNGRSLLAHTAYRMADVAASRILEKEGQGPAQRMRYEAIPWVVFTQPEVAGCGMTETEARQAGLKVTSHSFSLKISGRYVAEHPGENGSAKIVADASSGRIIGVQMLGSGVSELIFGAALMIENELRIKDVREVIFPHPTVSEVFRDAMWDMD
ncbi:MAG: dihydrolipoyl dehydrogenase [Spirochaetaceae bacterium]|nr:MAG: dihydrolipoyl dehydrogenase [Spirochaetaceae bacterium]